MKMIKKEKRIYKKWTIPCIITLIICIILSGIFYGNYSAPQRIIKKYLKNRFNYSYNNIEKNLHERKNLLSTEYLLKIDENGIVENFRNEVYKKQLTSQLGEYNIQCIYKADQNYVFIVTVVSYIQDATNNILNIDMTAMFTVKRYNLWKCLITDIESISYDDMEHENHYHEHDITQ